MRDKIKNIIKLLIESEVPYKDLEKIEGFMGVKTKKDLLNMQKKDLLLDVFGDNERIFIPYQTDSPDENVTFIKEVLRIIQLNTEKISLRYENENPNYITINERKVKFVKGLNKIKDLIEKDKINTDKKDEVISKINGLLKFYEEYSQKINKEDNLLIAISKNPEDIVTMSTSRRWSSCMDIIPKKNKERNPHYIRYDIEKGTIIAYLIKENDKGIDDPLKRVLIKPYFKVNDPEEYIYLVEPNVYQSYGKTDDNLVEFVQNWVDKNINGENTYGLYKIESNLYCDTGKKTEFKGFKNYEDLSGLFQDEQYEIITESLPYLDELSWYGKILYEKNFYKFMKSEFFDEKVFGIILTGLQMTNEPEDIDKFLSMITNYNDDIINKLSSSDIIKVIKFYINYIKTIDYIDDKEDAFKNLFFFMDGINVKELTKLLKPQKNEFKNLIRKYHDQIDNFRILSDIYFRDEIDHLKEEGFMDEYLFF